MTEQAAKATTSPDTTAAGVGYTLASILCFSGMDVMIKHLGGDYPVVQLIFFRCAVAMVPIFFLIYRAGGFGVLKTNRPGVHLLRATFGMSAMFCVFNAFVAMPLADAVTIIFTAPLAMTALSVPILGEKVGIHRWSAVIIGFVGVVVIVNPGGGVIDPAALYAIGAALCMAMAMITVRRLSATEHSVCITFYFTFAGVVVSGIALFFSGWVTPNWQDFIMLSSIGVLGGIAQYFKTQGFRLAEIGIVAPLEYSQMLWIAMLAFFIFGEVPTARLWIGGAIIVCSGLYMLHRETRKPGSRLPRLRGTNT